jgi:hypothetical protein
MNKWHIPRERNLDFLDELQKNLVNLNFNIPDELISSTPEDSWAQSVMGSLLALQSTIKDSTSIITSVFCFSFYDN